MNCCTCGKQINNSNSYPAFESDVGRNTSKRRCNECHENDVRNYTKNLEIRAAEKYKK